MLNRYARGWGNPLATSIQIGVAIAAHSCTVDAFDQAIFSVELERHRTGGLKSWT